MTTRTRPALRVAIATPPRLLADTLAGLLTNAGNLPDDIEVQVLPERAPCDPVRPVGGVLAPLDDPNGAQDGVEVDHDGSVDLAITVSATLAPAAPLVLVLDDAAGSTGGGTVCRPDGVAVVRLTDLDEVIELVRSLASGVMVEVGG